MPDSTVETTYVYLKGLALLIITHKLFQFVILPKRDPTVCYILPHSSHIPLKKIAAKFDALKLGQTEFDH